MQRLQSEEMIQHYVFKGYKVKKWYNIMYSNVTKWRNDTKWCMQRLQSEEM